MFSDNRRQCSTGILTITPANNLEVLPDALPGLEGGGGLPASASACEPHIYVNQITNPPD